MMDEPVRILWNAVSTFEASSADVSMNDSPLSPTLDPPNNAPDCLGIDDLRGGEVLVLVKPETVFLSLARPDVE